MLGAILSKAVGSHVEFELLKVILHSDPLKTFWADRGHHGDQKVTLLKCALRVPLVIIVMF